MDAIDIQQIHNNNFTNTQYGKFQRILYDPRTLRGQPADIRPKTSESD